MVTFVLVPAGLVLLSVAYVLLSIILASRQSEGFRQAN